MDNKVDFYAIKRELAFMRCRVHLKSAEVKLEGETIKLNACCEDFKNQVTEKYKELVQKQLTSMVNDIFKKNFGR